MVFGFGEGKIEIMLTKTNFAFGETAEGALKLSLKGAKQARQLRVSIIAKQQTTQYGGRSNTKIMGASRSSQTDVLFSTDIILDGEKTYPVGEKAYQFKIQVPQENAIPKGPQGGIGTAIGALQALSGQFSQIKWFVVATLDIPGGRDISKSIQISVQ